MSEPRDARFMERALELAGTDCMRARAIETISAFPWGQAQARTPVDPSG